jgi:ankyrin repeat protein
MEIINALLAAGVDPEPQLNMHRPSRGGNSGRFVDPLLSTGCTPLLRAAMTDDMEVVRALLAKGASPNINDMGLTPFLVAAGVGAGTRGGAGLAAAASAGGVANADLMDLLIQHGANVNAQVTGTKTYSMRISRAPSANEGMTALHVAAQSGRADMVRYLIAKGANPEIVDSNGHKPIDLVGTGVAAGGGRGGAPTVAIPGAAASPAAAAAGRGGRGGPGAGRGAPPSAATLAEIRSLLQDAAAKSPK